MGIWAALSLPILYDLGPPSIRYGSRVIFYYLAMTCVATVTIPFSMLSPGNVENTILCARIMQRVSRILGLYWRIRNIERLEQTRSAVVVVNHQHSFDLLALFEMWPRMRRCAALAKEALFFAGPFGLAAWLNGTIFINRGKSKESRQLIYDKVT